MFWKTIYDKYVKLSILDIALCGIFIALWMVSHKFISINLGFMRMGIVYAWVIIIGLIFKPFPALITAILGDTITNLTSPSTMWMIEYALIYPSMALLVSFCKRIFKCKNDIYWVIFNSLMMGVTTIVVVVFSIIYRNFTNKSLNPETGFLFNQWFIYLILGFTTATVVGFYIFLVVKYWVTKHQKYKLQSSILTIITLTIVLFVWIWGPIAQIRYLALHFNKSYQDLWRTYEIYLVPRVLKTPIILPLYFIIVTSVYQAYTTLHFNRNVRW